MIVLGISGSLRSDSHNTRLLRAAARELPVDAELRLFEGLREVLEQLVSEVQPASVAA